MDETVRHPVGSADVPHQPRSLGVGHLDLGTEFSRMALMNAGKRVVVEPLSIPKTTTTRWDTTLSMIPSLPRKRLRIAGSASAMSLNGFGPMRSMLPEPAPASISIRRLP